MRAGVVQWERVLYIGLVSVCLLACLKVCEVCSVRECVNARMCTWNVDGC